jgi:hypothetical protein
MRHRLVMPSEARFAATGSYLVTHPQRLGKYQVTDVLGKGAMGVVYKAHDPDIQRTVAIKTIRRELVEDDDRASMVMARFKNDARAASTTTSRAAAASPPAEPAREPSFFRNEAINIKVTSKLQFNRDHYKEQITAKVSGGVVTPDWHGLDAGAAGSGRNGRGRGVRRRAREQQPQGSRSVRRIRFAARQAMNW